MTTSPDPIVRISVTTPDGTLLASLAIGPDDLYVSGRLGAHITTAIEGEIAIERRKQQRQHQQDPNHHNA